jgi:hypothetical protein
MIAVLPASGFREGRWLNGMGVSWEIAAEPRDAGAADFDWRLAIARIDADVPFSRYPGIDRVFTLIEGKGLTLDLEGRTPLVVRHSFVPHAFPGDLTTSCRLMDGPCRALNLFLRRVAWDADVRILQGAGVLREGGRTLLFALHGDVALADQVLRAGDAAIASGALHYDAGSSALYAARLLRKT